MNKENDEKLFGNQTIRKLIEQLQGLSEEQKDMPLMTYVSEAGEFGPFIVNPKELEMVIVELRYFNGKTHFHQCNLEEFADIKDRSNFAGEVTRKKTMII